MIFFHGRVLPEQAVVPDLHRISMKILSESPDVDA